jgi:hypothetical protein
MYAAVRFSSGVYGVNSRCDGERVAAMSQRQEEIAVLAGGCFWGVEEILCEVPGVIDTDVGYTGGWLENPTYHDTHDSKSGTPSRSG